MASNLTGYGRQLKNAGVTVERLGAGLVTVGALCLALQCYYLLTVPPASGYELSVFVAYPFAHWVAFGTALVVALGLFLLSGLARTTHWRHGIVLLATNYGLFFALPLFRNYHLYGRGQADKLLHLANVATIVETGHFNHLFYPLEHVFLSELIVAADVSRESVTYLFPYVATFVYILSVAVVVRYFVADRAGLAVGLFVGAPLVFTNFHLSINPSVISFLFVPLYLWILERYRRLGTGRSLALLVGFGAAFVLFHPMTTALVIGLVATTAVFARLFGRFETESWSPGRLSPLLPIPIAVAAFMWNLSPYGPRGLLQAMILVWLSGGKSVGAGQLARAAEVPLTPWQLVQQFVSLYGVVFVFLLAAGFIALRVAYDLYRGRADYAETFLSFQFGAGFFVAVMFFAVYFIASNPIRIARYMVTMAVLLVGVYLARALRRPSGRRRLLAAVLVVGVVAAAVVGAPATYRPNYQMTDTEYQGSEFLVNHFDTSINVRSLATASKMQAYVLRPDFLDAPRAAFRVQGDQYGLTRALGYDENRTAAESFGSSYLVTKQYDTEFYESNVFTPAQREAVFVYDETHLRRLARDPTVWKVYTNGGFEVWRVVTDGGNQSG